MVLTAEQRTLRSRIAAYAANARHDGRAITATARATYRASFERGHGCAVCPAVELPVDLRPAERARRADFLRRGHYARLALKSSRARSGKKRDAAEVQSPAASEREGTRDGPAAA